MRRLRTDSPLPVCPAKSTDEEVTDHERAGRPTGLSQSRLANDQGSLAHARRSAWQATDRSQRAAAGTTLEELFIGLVGGESATATTLDWI